MSTNYTGLEIGAVLTGTEIIPMEQSGELKKTTTQDIADLGSAAGYLIYTALMLQQNTDAPSVTILENTIGNIIWTRNGVGSYLATNIVFPNNKTIVIATGGIGAGHIRGYYDGEALIPSIATTDNSNAPADGVLGGAFVEIRIYP